jgi:flagellar motor switch/type III secretory pathway protein FliN
MAAPTPNPGVALEKTAIAAPMATPTAASAMSRIEQHGQWTVLAKLPLKLTVAVPLHGFKVRDLLALRPGVTIASEWLTSEDVPLTVGGVQLAWSEFEVVEQRMAIRLTRLA